MISTVTTLTLSIAKNGAVAGSLSFIGFLVLMSLLVQKEFASVAGNRFRSLVKILNTAIIPLLIAFVLIVASEAVAVIR